MKSLLVGTRNVDYVKEGKRVQGLNLFLVVPSTRTDVRGREVDRAWISIENPIYLKCTQLPIDTNVDIVYNRFGGIEDVTVPGLQQQNQQISMALPQEEPKPQEDSKKK